ncbi:hypothetical protein JMJ35_002664 [Cladonia borealis]|uniref:Uncharacterized protein n=1 Tax=Cladonia borealis TaxID=184061 RepID=A0AA39R7M2_9LECA|nr:hypothetical protein JMJ35_002664 [Cladonia borealis]
MPPPTSPLRAPPKGECEDRDPLLGNAYDLGFQDRRKGPHLSFTFLSIDAVIAARLTPNQLPHSIHDTPPGRLVVSPRGVIDSPPPEPFMSIDHGANMRYDPRSRLFNLFDLWGKPVIGGYRFPLPKLPERRRRRQGDRTGAETGPFGARDGKDEVAKGKGKGKGVRGDGCWFDKYNTYQTKIPSVAAHTAWYARNYASTERVGLGNGYVFDRYRELPSVVAHGAWYKRTEDGDDDDDDDNDDDDDDDDDGIENEERGGGYIFERYSELPSVLAHGAWCKRVVDGDEEEIERGDEKETEEEDEKEIEEEDDEETDEEDEKETEEEDDD